MGITKKVNDWITRSELAYKERQAQLDLEFPILIRKAIDEILGEKIKNEVRKAVEEHFKKTGKKP